MNAFLEMRPADFNQLRHQDAISSYLDDYAAGPSGTEG